MPTLAGRLIVSEEDIWRAIEQRLEEIGEKFPKISKDIIEKNIGKINHFYLEENYPDNERKDIEIECFRQIYEHYTLNLLKVLNKIEADGFFPRKLKEISHWEACKGVYRGLNDLIFVEAFSYPYENY